MLCKLYFFLCGGWIPAYEKKPVWFCHLCGGSQVVNKVRRIFKGSSLLSLTFTRTSYVHSDRNPLRLMAVPVKIQAPPWTAIRKLPHPSRKSGPSATSEPGFPEFFSTTVPGISSWLNIVFIHHPHGFFSKGEI